MINLVVLGSITEDIIKHAKSEVKRFVGGVPIYAAATAKVLDETIGVVSKVGTDFHIKNLSVVNSLGADLSGFNISGSSSMRFENKYDKKGNRTQKILSISEKITFEDIPPVYYSIPCIHLGPVFNEIDQELIEKVRKQFKIVSLDGQGFTRSIEAKTKKVILEPWLDYEKYLPKLDVLKVDDLELQGLTGAANLDEAIALALETEIKLLVITRAHKGAIIFENKKRFDIPAIPTNERDATGAGDTFITAFLLEYLKTNDCFYSGLIAAATASYKISTIGPIPTHTKEDVLIRLKEHMPDFELK